MILLGNRQDRREHTSASLLWHTGLGSRGVGEDVERPGKQPRCVVLLPPGCTMAEPLCNRPGLVMCLWAGWGPSEPAASKNKKEPHMCLRRAEDLTPVPRLALGQELGGGAE